MSTIISFTERELLRGKTVAPGWYLLKIEAVGEASSKDQGSTNYPVEGVIIKDAQSGSEEFAGVPIAWNFNSKAMGFAIGYFAAFGIEIKPGMRVDLKGTEGKVLKVYIENDTYQGRLVNRVNHKYAQADV